MTIDNYRGPRIRISTTRIVEILLWTRRGTRSLTAGETEYPDHIHSVMRRGLIAISGKDNVDRWITVTSQGYDFLRDFGPEAYR